MKEKLSRHKKSSKNSPDATEPRHRVSSISSSVTSESSARDVCEICERPGHDIFNCDLLREEVPAITKPPNGRLPQDLFCEDCESHGHTAADCPHSLDVF